MKNIKFKIILLVILLLAAALRLYRITDLPALNADEAALGYNAYSLLETGKDEHGATWPLVFKSFGDFKPGIYVYLALPFVKALGLTVLAVRLPGLILSILSVWFVYLLTREMFSSSRGDVKYQWLPHIAALVLAIMPWHLHFSRGGWETQVATALLLLGTFSFLKGLYKPAWLTVFISSYILAIYTYHSMRVIVPLLTVSLVLIYFKRLLDNRNRLPYLIILAVIGGILLLPLIWSLSSSTGISRAQGVSIFADPGPIARIDEVRGLHLNKAPLTLIRLIHNKATAYGLRFLENYLKHFSGNFLFIEGDEIQRNKVPEFGQLLLVSSPFLLFGLWKLMNNIRSQDESLRKSGWLILTWLLISPIPAALTFQSPHAVRALSMVVPLSIITALGIATTLNWLKTSPLNTLSVVCCQFLILALFAWDTGRYLHNYYSLMVPWFPFSSQYGFNELVPWVSERQNNYDQIFITDRYDQPYILFLFYSRYSPLSFQQQVILTSRDKFGFSTVKGYDSLHFEAIDLNNLKELYPRSLVIGTDEEVPENANHVKEFKLPGGQITFQAVEI